LTEFLEAAQPADTHLLIAVSTREDDAYMVAENFAPQYVQQLIFTKLDETSSYGSILSMCTKIEKPISYLTTGQNVPDDIETAQAERITDLFLNAIEFSEKS
jgi:flagellar biosynthesis protein FlhF